MEVTWASVKPPGGVGGDGGGQVTAIGLEATMLGKVLRGPRAGDQADKLADGIAHALPHSIGNVGVTVVGRAGASSVVADDGKAASVAAAQEHAANEAKQKALDEAGEDALKT
eukprot:594983-Pyramimonas_sp.AAC.1